MSENLNKKIIAEAVSEKYELSKKCANEIVDLVFEQVATALSGGKTVDIPGFGKFEVRDRAARTGINPKTMEKIDIPASKAVGFKVGKALKESVK